jgi:hypothetical protein
LSRARYDIISPLSHSRLETVTETNEKLADVYQRLLQAGVDRNESEREVKLKETLSSLQRIFPGERCLSSYQSNPPLTQTQVFAGA